MIQRIVLISVVVLSWLLMFSIAYSDCSIKQYFNDDKCRPFSSKIEKTNVAPISDNALSNIAAIKGQFGDSFGALTSLFSSLTLVIVYFSYQAQRSQVNSMYETLLDNKKYQEQIRFATEMAAARQSYSNSLESISILANDEKKITGRLALKYLWDQTFISPIEGGRPRISNIQQYPSDCLFDPLVSSNEIPRKKSDQAYRNMWGPLMKQITSGSVQTPTSWDNPRWVQEQIKRLTSTELQDLVDVCANNWRYSYSIHRYQLDSFFRCWYQVYIVALSAGDLVSKDIVFRETNRFKASLSNIELFIILANQVLAPHPGFPKAVRISEDYHIFEHYIPDLDPIGHLLGIVSDKKSNITNVCKIDSCAFART